MPLTPRSQEISPNGVPERVAFPQSVVQQERDLEAQRLQELLRALRGDEQGVTADVLASVRLMAPEGRPTYSE